MKIDSVVRDPDVLNLLSSEFVFVQMEQIWTDLNGIQKLCGFFTIFRDYRVAFHGVLRFARSFRENPRSFSDLFRMCWNDCFTSGMRSHSLLVLSLRAQCHGLHSFLTNLNQWNVFVNEFFWTVYWVFRKHRTEKWDRIATQRTNKKAAHKATIECCIFSI